MVAGAIEQMTCFHDCGFHLDVDKQIAYCGNCKHSWKTEISEEQLKSILAGLPRAVSHKTPFPTDYLKSKMFEEHSAMILAFTKYHGSRLFADRDIWNQFVMLVKSMMYTDENGRFVAPLMHNEYVSLPMTDVIPGAKETIDLVHKIKECELVDAVDFPKQIIFDYGDPPTVPYMSPSTPEQIQQLAAELQKKGNVMMPKAEDVLLPLSDSAIEYFNDLTANESTSSSIDSSSGDNCVHVLTGDSHGVCIKCSKDLYAKGECKHERWYSMLGGDAICSDCKIVLEKSKSLDIPITELVVPVPMLLHCPNTKCGAQHIDKGEWKIKPHKTHLCDHCDIEWRPFEYATVGVEKL